MAVHIHIHTKDKKVKDSVISEMKRLINRYGTKLKFLGDNQYYLAGDDNYFSGTLAEWNQAARELNKTLSK